MSDVQNPQIKKLSYDLNNILFAFVQIFDTSGLPTIANTVKKKKMIDVNK